MKSEVHRIHHSIDPRQTSVNLVPFVKVRVFFRSIRDLLRRLLGCIRILIQCIMKIRSETWRKSWTIVHITAATILWLLGNKIANLISKLNFYKLIPYPMDNLLNRSAQTGPPNVRKRRPVFPPADRSIVLYTPQMVPRTSFLSRQPDVIASVQHQQEM